MLSLLRNVKTLRILSSNFPQVTTTLLRCDDIVGGSSFVLNLRSIFTSSSSWCSCSIIKISPSSINNLHRVQHCNSSPFRRCLPWEIDEEKTSLELVNVQEHMPAHAHQAHSSFHQAPNSLID